LILQEIVVKELTNRMILYYTGQRRAASDIIRNIIGNYLSRKKKEFVAMNRAREINREMKEALFQGNIDRLAELMTEYWENWKTINPGATNDFINSVFGAIKDIISGGKQSGTGGGGFLIFIAKKGKINELKTRLEKISKDFGGRIYDYEINHEGIKVSTGQQQDQGDLGRDPGDPGTHNLITGDLRDKYRVPRMPPRMPQNSSSSVAESSEVLKARYDNIDKTFQGNGVNVQKFFDNPDYFSKDENGKSIVLTGISPFVVHWPLKDYGGGKKLIRNLTKVRDEFKISVSNS